MGLTGGIGSGKSAVSDRLEQQGITVVDADVVSREVVARGSPALDRIRTHFGDTFILSDGHLDRARLRRQVFSDPDAKRWLEELLHPLIDQEVKRQLEAAHSPYALLVSPLLIEMQQTAICQRIVVVDSTDTAQLERAMARDGNSEDQIRRIMNSQTNRAQRLAAATDVIDNNASLAQLHTKVDALHEQLLVLAQVSL